jgi:acetylornithine deacetylase
LRNVRFPPFSTNPDHEFITALRDAAQSAGIPPRIEGFSAVADLAWYSKWGVPGALFGAGDVRLAHGPDEHVRCDDLITASKTLALALLRWCGHA